MAGCLLQGCSLARLNQTGNLAWQHGDIRRCFWRIKRSFSYSCRHAVSLYSRMQIPRRHGAWLVARRVLRSLGFWKGLLAWCQVALVLAVGHAWHSALLCLDKSGSGFFAVGCKLIGRQNGQATSDNALLRHAYWPRARLFALYLSTARNVGNSAL